MIETLNSIDLRLTKNKMTEKFEEQLAKIFGENFDAYDEKSHRYKEYLKKIKSKGRF